VHKDKKAFRTMADAACDFLDHFHIVANILGKLFDRIHIVIDMMCNLQIPRRRHQRLFFCKCVQPLKRILNVRPPDYPLEKLFYFIVS
jgi:hypothetical protein